MLLTRGITGFWILALLTLNVAEFGDTRKNSLNEPVVPFPPACPTAHNLAAICHHGNGRPKYLPSYFPPSGFSHFRRRGNAINRLESWYSACCRGEVPQQRNNQLLCCVQQAWKQALSQFCVEEYSTMTDAYVCCTERGEARWTCFNSELPNPFYEPIPGYRAPTLPKEPLFTFIPLACWRSIF